MADETGRYATDPNAKVRRPEEIGGNPVFTPPFKGPWAPNPTVPEGRNPPDYQPSPAALNMSESMISAVTLNCLDLEAQRAWYERVFGMKVLKTFHRDGDLFEYLMGYEHGRGARLALAKAMRPVGYNDFTRLNFNVPDKKGLYEFLLEHGAMMRNVYNGRVYMLIDPEGNAIEFYTIPS